MVKNIWMSHIGRCTELGYLCVGHISSNYHQHSKCLVLFVKHHYYHLSLFKKLLSSCWLIQVYIQCKTISSCRHFRHQQNRNWNSVRHCIRSWQKMQKLIICNSALFCNVSKTYSSHVSSPPKCLTQLFKNTQKLLYTPQWHFISLHIGPLSCGNSVLEWLLPEAKREKFSWKQKRVNLLIPEMRLTGS